jgi:hypothetical protein
MKRNNNYKYFAILSQIMLNYFGGNILGPGKEIPEYVKKKIYLIRESVLQYFNKINDNNRCNDFYYLESYKIKEHDWLQLNLIQPIADYCNLIIILIDYTDYTS